MNVPEAGFCSGCGQELGLEPIGAAATLPCPACKQPLTAYAGAGQAPDSNTLFDCALCGGQFVEHALLREMLHHHEHAAIAEGAAHLAGRPDPRTGYLPCPACASLMNRKNFGGSSGVIVDVCKKHGTWFDLGELPRVLAFVAAGGLERARQREEEERARARREPIAAHQARPHATSSHDHTGEYVGGASLTDLLVDLLLH